MATISSIIISIKGDNNHAKAALAETERGVAHVGHSSAGSSRALGFLGRQIEHIGKASGGAFGEGISGLGEFTAESGHAIHGLHAMHAVTGLLKGAMTGLFAITPLGWTAIIGGAVAATAAYFAFHSEIKTTEEKAKELKETLGDLAEKTGAAFDRGITEKLKEIQKGGWFVNVTEEVNKLNKAIALHNQKIAQGKVDSSLDKMREEAEKLNSTPLQIFIENLNKSKISATEGAEELRKFKEYAAQVDLGKAHEAVKKLHEEMEQHNSSKEAVEATKLWEQYNKTHDETYAKLAKEVETINQQKIAAEALKKQAEEYKKEEEEHIRKQEQMASKAKSLLESASPFAKYRDEVKELNELLQQGFINISQYSVIAQREKQNLLKQLMSEAPKYQAGYLEYGSAEAAKEISRDEELRQQEEWAMQQIAAAEKQNDLTSRANDMLATIAGRLGFSVVNF